MCGRVVGYQYKYTDAVYPGNYSHKEYGSVITRSHNDINSYYVDGVSITCGSPHQHVWTLMAGISSSGNHPWTGHNDAHYNCPCSPGSPQNSTLQSFISTDYFCESGNPATDGLVSSTHFTTDPCGMVKTVVVKVLVVQLLVSHGSIRSLTLPLLTTLS